MTTPPSRFFPRDYTEARAAFLAACDRAGARVLSHPHPLAGPGGEALFLDEALLGSEDARRILFLASGTHGIEGFCGSGIQGFLLHQGLGESVPAGCAVVLLHAINPHGFARMRRVNEDNVDLNRNFLDHAAAHPENADYEALYDVLNPAVLDPAALAGGLGVLKRFEEERGWAASYRALSGGQYRHPRGLQYGGVEPAWSNRTLREVWGRRGSRTELAAFVDLHSGLGPCGTGLLLQTASEAGVAARLARSWWPDVIRSEPGEGSDAALASGLIGPAFVAALAPVPAVGLVLEFGTRELTEVMLALQADNWLAQHGDRGSEEGRSIVRRMREAFLLDEDGWKESVCVRAKEVVEQALRGMAGFAPEVPR